MITAIVIVALVLVVLSLIFPEKPLLLKLSVLLLCVALLAPFVIK